MTDEELEDADDIREGEAALKEIEEKGSIPFDEMKRRCEKKNPVSDNAFKTVKLTQA